MAQQLKANSLPVALASDTDTLPVGGIYLATKPTYTDGQRASGQFNSKGALLVEEIITPDAPALGMIATGFHLTTGAKTLLKAFTGRVFGIIVTNSASGGCWTQWFDAALAATPTLGTTVPMFELVMAINANASPLLLPPPGVYIANGLVLACTTAPTGATTVTGVIDVTILADRSLL